MPYSLTEGQTTLYVEVVDAAGNISDPSNSVGVAITSTEADYNGGPASDPALFARNTATGQLQWIVQTPPGRPAPGPARHRRPLFAGYVFNGTLASGSAVVTAIGSTSGLVVGQDVTGTGIPAGATIKAINGGPRSRSPRGDGRRHREPPRPRPEQRHPLRRRLRRRRPHRPGVLQPHHRDLDALRVVQLRGPRPHDVLDGRHDRRGGRDHAPPSPSSATSTPTVRPRWASSRSTPRARASGSSPAPAPAPDHHLRPGGRHPRPGRLRRHRLRRAGRLPAQHRAIPDLQHQGQPARRAVHHPRLPAPAPHPGPRAVRQPGLLQSGRRQRPVGADLRQDRAGRLRPQHRRVHDPRAQRRLHRRRLPGRRHPGPGRLPRPGLGPGGRLPAQHRPVHRGDRPGGR